VHLVDFGIARIVGKVPLTHDRNIVGTPEFLAPELLDVLSVLFRTLIFAAFGT